LANADSIAAIDAGSGKVRAFFSTHLPKQEFSGNETDALAQSKDGKRLFAASAATDSVAVFDTTTLADGRSHVDKPIAAAGFIPTEWYTLAVAVADNDLLIATGKGLGTGPNSTDISKIPSRRKRAHPYIPTLLHGSIARVSLAEVDKNLPEFTRVAQEQMQLLADPTALPFHTARIPFIM
jgi:hypothetical protein